MASRGGRGFDPLSRKMSGNSRRNHAWVLGGDEMTLSLQCGSASVREIVSALGVQDIGQTLDSYLTL